MECVNCGAPLEIKEYNSTCKCGYCGSYIILDERVGGTYRPHLVLPFKIGIKQAVDLLKKEFKSRIFTPGTFLSESTLEEMKGIYVPFWMYDYKANIDYTGKGTKVTQRGQSRKRHEQIIDEITEVVAVPFAYDRTYRDTVYAAEGVVADKRVAARVIGIRQVFRADDTHFVTQEVHTMAQPHRACLAARLPQKAVQLVLMQYFLQPTHQKARYIRSLAAHLRA